MAISASDFAYVSAFARDEAAIVLEPGKEYLVETRFAPLARDAGHDSLDAFLAQLRAAPLSSPMRARALDALTTNETSFFRDFTPYEALREHFLPELVQARQGAKALNIWSAACSAGQEPVSLAILLKHHFPALATWRVKLLATDLSGTVLALAKAASYTQFEVNRGLPAPLLLKYFTKEEAKWRVNADIRAMITYEPRNLIGPWPTHEKFDLVMLRNVMIYFDIPTRQRILEKVRARLAPDGLLMLGSAETTINLDPAFEVVRIKNATAFRLRPGAGA
jgi:chemotaxis protein methyltransferase CheR